MIRAIYIIAEGPTEEEFINSLISPYFSARHPALDIRAIKMETSPGHKGGDITFARYRRNVALLLKESNVIVTSLIDFYQLKTDFPKYQEAQKLNQAKDKVAFLENACAEVIGSSRFVPYIQLHEFEALIFSSRRGFDEYFSHLTRRETEQLEAMFDQYPNPEMINDGSTTAPSKRLESIIPGYEKVLHGNIIALENGFPAILKACPRFKAWIMLLEEQLG